jgi:hypothetical protein
MIDFYYETTTQDFFPRVVVSWCLGHFVAKFVGWGNTPRKNYDIAQELWIRNCDKNNTFFGEKRASDSRANHRVGVCHPSSIVNR